MIRTQVVMQVTGSCCKYRRSFTRLPAAHLLLCSPVPNRPQIHTSPWPGVRDPCYKSSQPQPSKSPCFQNLILNGKKKKDTDTICILQNLSDLHKDFILKAKYGKPFFSNPVLEAMEASNAMSVGGRGGGSHLEETRQGGWWGRHWLLDCILSNPEWLHKH